MDGLVLSVAIGFRSYAGDGITDWLAAIGGIATAVSAFAILITFLYSVKSGNILKARTTLDQARKLEELIEAPSNQEVRDSVDTIREICNYYKDNGEIPNEHFKYFSFVYDKSLSLLSELAATNDLIKQKAISRDLIKSHAGRRALREYDLYLKPLLHIRIMWEKEIPDSDPAKIYYKNVWVGILELMASMRKESRREKFKRVVGRLKNMLRNNS